MPRPKGSQNKITSEVKDKLQLLIDDLIDSLNVKDLDTNQPSRATLVFYPSSTFLIWIIPQELLNMSITNLRTNGIYEGLLITPSLKMISFGPLG